MFFIFKMLVAQFAGEGNDRTTPDKRRATTFTYMYYIPTGKLNGKSKSSVLLARVRNAISNRYSLSFLQKALVDGTARRAFQNLCACPGVQQYLTLFRG